MAGNIAWRNARHLLSKKEAAALDTSQVQVFRISPWPSPQAAVLHALTSASVQAWITATGGGVPQEKTN
jgi:hypothetical protein